MWILSITYRFHRRRSSLSVRDGSHCGGDVCVDAGLDGVDGEADGIVDREGSGGAVADDADAIDAEEE